MMYSFDPGFSEIPYINRTKNTETYIVSGSFFVEGVWRNWFANSEAIFEVTSRPVEGNYFGDKAARSSDQYFLLLDFLAQKFMTSKVYVYFDAIWNDLQNLVAILAKLRLLHQIEMGPTKKHRFCVTEIEHLFVIVRSIFDLLQEIIRFLLSKVKLHDGTKIRELPSSFNDIVGKDSLEDRSKIYHKYNIPKPFQEWYEIHRKTFMGIRHVRDRICHNGYSCSYLFFAEKGIGVFANRNPFVGFFDWPTEVATETGLVPVRPALAKIVKFCIEATESFAESFIKSIDVIGEDNVPGLKLYSRGANDVEFCQLNQTITELLWEKNVIDLKYEVIDEPGEQL